MKRLISLTLILVLLMPTFGTAQKTKQSEVRANTIKMLGALGNRCVQTSSSGVLVEVPCSVPTPTFPNDACSAGQWSYDALYFYMCTGTNQWQRVALSPEWGSVTINVKTYGAIGDDTADDTAEINAAIAALQPGYTLYFPCGTYKVSSALNAILVNNVTIAGGTGGCSTIHGTGTAYIIMRVGSSGLSARSTLTANAAELSNSFSATFSQVGGFAVNDLALIEQGGKDFSTDVAPGNEAGCDISGCRGEVVQIQSVNGNTATVTTQLHDSYNYTTNDAHVRKVTTVLSQVTVRDLVFDGSNTVDSGLQVAGVVNSTVTNVTAKNTQREGILTYYTFNTAWNNIALNHCGNTGRTMMLFWGQGKPSANGITIRNGTYYWGLATSTTADGTFNGVDYDGTGATLGGRPIKVTATRYSTFNDMTVKNTQNNGSGYYGVVQDYYASHNTFNRLTMSGIFGAMFVSFGNYNQFNKLVNANLTAYNSTGYPVHQGASALGQYNDHNLEISGGTMTGVTGVWMVNLLSNNAYVHNVNFVGPAHVGIALQNSSGGCVNNNVFASSPAIDAGLDIYYTGGTGALFNANTTPHGTNPSSLPTGTCP